MRDSKGRFTDGNNEGNTFTSENQPTNKRSPSIKKQLKELALHDGKITYSSSDVIEVHDDGSVTVAVSTEEMIANKLYQMANDGKPSDSLKAIQLIMNYIDGKPKETLELNDNTTSLPERRFIIPPGSVIC